MILCRPKRSFLKGINQFKKSEIAESFYSAILIMNKHNQKPTDMFNKQDVTVYFIY